MVENDDWIKSDKAKTIDLEIKSLEYAERKDIIEVNIPDGVTTIGERAFAKCTNLKKIIIPDSVTSIGAGAFSECENLEEIVLPKNIKKLNYRTFADCKRLKKIIIPEGVEELDWAVFSGCENLEEIILPNSIKKVNKQLFLNCKKLKSIVLPKNLTYLPDEFFRGCTNLDISLDKNIIKLGNAVFQDCHKLTSFPTQVEEIGSNCFRNCRSLKNVLLNKNITTIPDSAFMGCTNLEDIVYDNDSSLDIGEAAFKNCKSLRKIPDFVKEYNKYAFEGCNSIKEIILTSSYIPEGCFRDCKGIEKVIQKEVKCCFMGSFAFSGCTSLTNIYLPYLAAVPAEAFSNCHNLESVKLSDYATRIGSRAFYRCYNLKDFTLPDNVSYVGKEAMRYCNSLSFLYIPKYLKSFGDAAFSNMASLEYIDSPSKENFYTPDHKILVMPTFQKLVLYASGSKEKSYTLKDYNVFYEDYNREIIRPISYIGSYVFAGAHNLEELTICGCTNDIEITAFDDCPNLKKLTVEGISFGACPSFNIRDNGRYYSEDFSKHKMDFSFDSIYFTGDLSSIYPNGFKDFKKIKHIYFSTDHPYYIGGGAFSNLDLVEDVYIPDNITAINNNAFSPNTTLHFSNGLAIKNLISMTSRTTENNKTNYLYTLPDMYYIVDDDEIVTLTQEDIKNTCNNSELICDDPLSFYDYMKHLKSFNLEDTILKDGILIKNLNFENMTCFFQYLKDNKQITIDVLKYSNILDDNDDCSIYLLREVKELISKIEILKKHNIKNPLFYNKLLLSACTDEDFEKLITLYPEQLEKTLINSNLLHLIKKSSDNEGHLEQNLPSKNNNSFDMDNKKLIEKKVIGSKLLSFVSFIKENNINSKLLMNEIFISNDSQRAREFMLRFNNNLKRLTKFSGVFDSNVIKTNAQNFRDLLILLIITGALEDDPIVSQRAITFITEKIFDNKLPNGDDNPYYLKADDIHRIFNFKKTDIYYDPEFADFFIENYKKLYLLEISHSGLIERIYDKFKEISKTSTSDHGSQRHLKVTVDKCTQFLAKNKFEGITAENKDLAVLIGWWYDNNSTWENAQRVYKESLSAPRNIFAPYVVDDDENIKFDNNPKYDLREISDDEYTYEWLPKQSYENLILGKYCNCCAHIEGAGQGIMRASMILDCCQNLVIRYHGEIIAKSIIYVNREAGYAVFNNIEGSLKFNSQNQHKSIYEAFMRGARAFLKEYNQNNPLFPITKITIGTNRNKVIEYFNNTEHPKVPVENALCYGEYSLNNSGYAGDWASGQRLVLKR